MYVYVANDGGRFHTESPWNVTDWCCIWSVWGVRAFVCGNTCLRCGSGISVQCAVSGQTATGWPGHRVPSNEKITENPTYTHFMHSHNMLKYHRKWNCLSTYFLYTWTGIIVTHLQRQRSHTRTRIEKVWWSYTACPGVSEWRERERERGRQ